MERYLFDDWWYRLRWLEYAPLIVDTQSSETETIEHRCYISLIHTQLIQTIEDAFGIAQGKIKRFGKVSPDETKDFALEKEAQDLYLWVMSDRFRFWVQELGYNPEKAIEGIIQVLTGEHNGILGLTFHSKRGGRLFRRKKRYGQKEIAC